MLFLVSLGMSVSLLSLFIRYVLIELKLVSHLMMSCFSITKLRSVCCCLDRFSVFIRSHVLTRRWWDLSALQAHIKYEFTTRYRASCCSLKYQNVGLINSWNLSMCHFWLRIQDVLIAAHHFTVVHMKQGAFHRAGFASHCWKIVLMVKML